MNKILHSFPECIECGSHNVRRTDDLMRTSNPPKYQVECVHCGDIRLTFCHNLESEN